MDSIRGVMSFVQAAQTGSFARAANVLGVSPVAVSKNVARLEASLGVRPFQRSTRKLALTREGEAFVEQCERPLRDLAQAHERTRESATQPVGRVRVTAVSPFVRSYLAPLLPEFAQRHPGVELDIEVSEAVADLIGEKFDVGIRVGALADSAYIARRLGPLRFVVCGAPDYLARNGVPGSIDDLMHHSALSTRDPAQTRSAGWLLAGPGGRLVLPVRGPLICNDLLTLMQACVAWAGLAQLPLPMALPALRAGGLKVVLPETAVEGLHLYVHYPSRRHLPARVRAFVEFVVEKLEKHPDFQVRPSDFAVRPRNLARDRAQCRVPR
jgi:DNA-binding transcriptional LysR family regulator